MTHLIKADFYRLKHSKPLYFTFGSLLVLLITLIIAFLFNNPTQQSFGVAATTMFEGSTLAIYFILPIVIMVATTDFSSNVVRNALSGGVSRTQYFFSKLILSSILTTIVYTIYILLPAIVIPLATGSKNAIDSKMMTSFLCSFFLQLLVMLSINSFALMLTYLTKRTAAVNTLFLGTFLIVPLIFTIIMALVFMKNLDALNNATHFFNEIYIGKSLESFITVAAITWESFFTNLIATCVWLIATFVLGFFALKRSDLK